MDVMRGGIVVLDLNRLSCHHAENVGMVLAALLIEHHRILGQFEGAIAKAIFHVHEDVGQVAAADNDAFGLIGALAAGILAHIDLGGLGSGAIELHRAIHGGDCGWIDGSGRGLGLLLGGCVSGLLGIFFLAACRQNQQSANCEHAGDDGPMLSIHDVALSLGCDQKIHPAHGRCASTSTRVVHDDLMQIIQTGQF